ncbi:hypothetical protein CLFO_39530 [Clostridium formicaceticum]|uniref:Uncharacterized protein n=1 Tax=Clostridium formicaceticum TaxID=1497 RepID=A0AAC9WJU7_9CLOT|nr:hypothetical protein BJL90_03560 [Clostridium formicaceticum]ARE89475.1 hypothetical protein CLFO_39530 [Clostridium formicaceticum]
MEKYHMRRQDRQINDENELSEILLQGKYIVISMCRNNEKCYISDAFDYQWMLHQIHKEVSFEERTRL